MLKYNNIKDEEKKKKKSMHVRGNGKTTTYINMATIHLCIIQVFI